MDRTIRRTLILALAGGMAVFPSLYAAIRNAPETTPRSSSGSTGSADEMSADLQTEMESKEAAPKSGTPKKKILTGTDGFLAGADWEFDGFVAGGQGQEIRSMFVTNDLLYLNVGYAQGVEPGDRVGIYRRGDRIRDPQSGKFIGYEVRKIAVSEITDKVDDETCSARVIRTSDGIEIGDLVRRE